jgi:putative DNA primase/helicase
MTHDRKCVDGLRHYCNEAVEGILKEMASTTVGSRNEQLNSCAFAIGQLAATGLLEGAAAIARLIAAAVNTGIPASEAHATVRSGYEAGLKQPRDLSRACKCNGNRARPAPGARAGKPVVQSRPDACGSKPINQDEVARRIAAVQRMEVKLLPCAGTSAETYLSRRGLKLDRIEADDLRFAKDLGYYEGPQCLGYHDAIVARVRSFASGDIIAHQRTYLAPNGAGKASVATPKKALGSTTGGAILLGDVRNAEHAGFAEGLEDAATGQLGASIPTAAVMGKGMFEHVTPGPNLRRATLFADAGDDARVAVERLAERLQQQSIAVRVVYPPTGYKDLNELLMAAGLDAVKAAIDASPWALARPTATSRNKTTGRDDWLYDGISVAAVAARHIDWFWEPWIAFGKVSMIFGQPGQGKSQLTAYLASRVTTGSSFVNGKRCASGSVVMIACEDDVADTVRPRLAAAGADLSKVHVLNATRAVTEHGKLSEPGPFNLAFGMQALEQMVDDIGDVKLIVIDPITAYLSGTDSHKNADVRAVLLPLQEMAARKGLAVVLVTHMNKATGMDAMSRATGSGAFVAAARAAFLVSKLHDQPEKRAFLPAKNNIGDDATGLTFTIESCSVENGIKTSRVVFDAAPTSMTADELLEGSLKSGSSGQSAKDDAIEWLSELLASGPVPAEEVFKRAEIEGLATKTIRRAKREIGVISEREGFGKEGIYSWRLPDGAKD